MFLTTNKKNARNLIRYSVANKIEVTIDDGETGIGTHLAVDTTNKTVYWILFTVETNYKIYKTTYEGHTTQIGPDQTGSINTIDIAEGNGYFYILDSTSYEIRKYDKATDLVASTISLAYEVTRIIVVAGKWEYKDYLSIY